MDQVWQILRAALGDDLAEFRDLAGMLRAVLRLALAAALGGLLGYERTIRRRPAGLRTHMLVALGAAGFVMVPAQLGMALGDLSRVIQGLMTGIGFLGAGVNFRGGGERAQARGLTTAAGIWLTAAAGMAVGLGRPATALLVVVLALVILSPLRRIEGTIERKRGGGERPEGRPDREAQR